MAGIPPFPKFEVFGEENSLGIRWTKYVAKLENLFVAMNIDSKKRKKALLLHYAGDEVFEIYETMDLSSDESNYDQVKQELSGYFQPKKNKEFERYEFRNMQQHHEESIDQFATRLRQKAENCEFGDKEGEIKSQIIQGCVSKRLRIKCLEEEKSLSDILTMARTMEIAQKQSDAMDKYSSNDLSVNKLKQKPTRSSDKNQNKSSRLGPSQQQATTQTCRNCGGNYPHSKKCPAVGAECYYCHKQNHFISVCRKRNRKNGTKRSQRLNEIAENNSDTESVSSESESVSPVSEVSFRLKTKLNSINNKKVPNVTLKINGVDAKVLVDTGASINIIDQSCVDKMRPKPHVQRTKIKAFAFGQSKPLPLKGKYKFIVESGKKFTTAEFYVMPGGSETLLSYETAIALEIIPTIKSVTDNDFSDLCDQYKNLFTGLGQLKGRQIKSHIDESVVPVAQAPRRIPFHIREKVERDFKNKHYADCKCHAQPCEIQPGDRVLVKRTNTSKLNTCFDPVPAIVVRRKGSMITAEHNGKLTTRDVSYFKPVVGIAKDESSTPPRRRSNHEPQRPARHRQRPARLNDYV